MGSNEYQNVRLLFLRHGINFTYLMPQLYQRDTVNTLPMYILMYHSKEYLTTVINTEPKIQIDLLFCTDYANKKFTL
jgi:hypothetical protein